MHDEIGRGAAMVAPLRCGRIRLWLRLNGL